MPKAILGPGLELSIGNRKFMALFLTFLLSNYVIILITFSLSISNPKAGTIDCNR